MDGMGKFDNHEYELHEGVWGDMSFVSCFFSPVVDDWFFVADPYARLDMVGRD